jgi:hypothetical protein
MNSKENNSQGKGLKMLFLLLAICIFGGAWYLGHYTDFIGQSFTNEVLVTTCMTVLVPLLYFVLIALSNKQGIIPLLVGFLICTIVASFILPDEQKTVLGYVETCLIVTETLLVILIALKIRRIVIYYKEEKASNNHYGFSRQVKAAAARAMGSEAVGEIIAAEVTNIYYSFFFYKIKSEVPEGATPFTSYKEYKLLFIVVGIIGLIEVVGAHFLLDFMFSSTTAWVVTIITIYGMLFLIAEFVVMVRRPSILFGDKFYFQMGLRWSAIIPLQAIDKIVKLDYKMDTNKMMKCAIQSQYANVVLFFKEEQVINGVFGLKKKGKALLINVDEPELLIQAINERKAEGEEQILNQLHIALS